MGLLHNAFQRVECTESKQKTESEEEGDIVEGEAEKARQEGKPCEKHNVVEGESSLPAIGEKNSSADLLNPDGSVKQRRYYGLDGKAQEDIDYHHTNDGTHQFPHTHQWDWSQKSPRLPSNGG